MFRSLFALGVTLTAVSLFCVLITGAHPPEFYASLMALIVSVLMMVLATLAPWVLKHFWHVEWTGRGPVTHIVRTDRPDPGRSARTLPSQTRKPR